MCAQILGTAVEKLGGAFLCTLANTPSIASFEIETIVLEEAANSAERA